MDSQTRDQDVYIQSAQKGGKGIGVVVTGLPEMGYTAFVYSLEGQTARLERTQKFDSGSQSRDRAEFQQFVKELTGTDAVAYCFDTDRLLGPLSGALEDAVRNHVDMS